MVLVVKKVMKNSPANAGNIRDMGLIPGWGRSPEEGMATYSSMVDNPMSTIGLDRVR